MHEAVAFLNGTRQEPRLLEVTHTLCAEMLQLGGLAADTPQALQQVDHVLHSGQALERFARMVHALGSPSDFCERPTHYLAAAPAQLAVLAPRSGWITSMATRDIGLQLIELGGGRRIATDVVDSRVGLSQCVPVGTVRRGRRHAGSGTRGQPSRSRALRPGTANPAGNGCCASRSRTHPAVTHPLNPFRVHGIYATTNTAQAIIA